MREYLQPAAETQDTRSTNRPLQQHNQQNVFYYFILN
jgi:hypothetical protein